jgi:Rap1a immunity proteins
MTMRVHVIVAGLALLTVGDAKGSVVDTGTDAQSECQLWVDGYDSRAAGRCEGMLETAMYFSPSMPADVRACPPQQGSILESAKVMLRYMRQNPDRLSEPGITLAIEAFRDAWPCHDDGSEATAGSKPGQKKRAPKKTKMTPNNPG